MTRVVASIEARMSSSRFPGKVLTDIAGAPALTRLLRRLRTCRNLDDIVVATSDGPSDDAIADWARQEQVAVYRGSEDDVLARVVDAQRSLSGDIVVEITGDATLTDPAVVDIAVATFLLNDCDVVSTAARKSFPIGIDAQVFRLGVLEKVADTVFDAPVREHVSLYFYEHPEIYRTIHLAAPPDAHAPELRLTLDYPEDRDLFAALYAHLSPQHGETFGAAAVVAMLNARPELLGTTQDLAIKAVR